MGIFLNVQQKKKNDFFLDIQNGDFFGLLVASRFVHTMISFFWHNLECFFFSDPPCTTIQLLAGSTSLYNFWIWKEEIGPVSQGGGTGNREVKRVLEPAMGQPLRFYSPLLRIFSSQLQYKMFIIEYLMSQFRFRFVHLNIEHYFFHVFII